MDSTKQSGGAGDFWLLVLPTLLRSPVASPLVHIAATVVAAVIILAALVRWAGTPGGCAWWNVASTTAALPPGPRGWPVIGSLMEMGGLAHRRLAAKASALKAKSLMALSLGSTRLVISSDPSTAKDILASSSFADRPLKQSAQQLLFGRAIGFAPYGDYWRRLRRIAANHLFSPRRIAAHESRRQSEASKMLDSIASASKIDMQSSISDSASPIEIRPFLQHASLNNVMQSVFGRSYSFLGFGPGHEEAAELQSMVREGFDLLGAFNWADHIPALRSIDPQAIHERCSLLVPKVSSFVQNVINEHRANPQNGDEADFVDVLLGFNGDEALKDEDMIAVLWEMIFRGTDTTAILCEWILAELVLHPEIQASLFTEICRTIESNASNSSNSFPIADSQISKMPLLNAVIKETLRMHPPGPLLSWARLATEDVNIAGHFIPKGTTAMVNMWSITHDESIWKNPEVFAPMRFMPGGEVGSDFDIKGTDLRLAPFGAGRRVCPGRALGLATVSLWLARLVHRFEFIAHPDFPVDLSEVLKLSCEMVNPLKVVPVERIHS